MFEKAQISSTQTDRELFWFPLSSRSTGFGLLPSIRPMLFSWNHVLSFLYPLFCYHLWAFPLPCHWIAFTKRRFSSMDTKGFCRAWPALCSIHEGDENGDPGNTRASFKIVIPTTVVGKYWPAKLYNLSVLKMQHNWVWWKWPLILGRLTLLKCFVSSNNFWLNIIPWELFKRCELNLVFIKCPCCLMSNIT